MLISTIKTLIATARPPFLILTPAVLFVAYSVSYWQQGSIDTTLALLIFIASLSAHISVNAFNEYADFNSGLDLNTERTPFSGGSGGLPANPSAAGAVLTLAIITLSITTLIGLYFIMIFGISLLPIGLVGVALIYFYTIWITKYAWLCLITPGLAFGPIFIIGSSFVLTGSYSIAAVVASMPIFFLTNNLLLLNQFPDISADKQAGRNHYLIRYGQSTASRLFVIFNLLAYLSLIIPVCFNVLPPWILISMMTVFLSIPTSLNVLKNHNNSSKLLPAMAQNVAINILTPVLMASGLLITAHFA